MQLASSHPDVPEPRCVPLAEAASEAVGGKARGLHALLSAGLHVPAGFVVVGARPGRLPADLDHALQVLGDGPVAVRSSAVGEDGAEASFAGQYLSVLDVRGRAAVREAIVACLASAHGQRADVYRTRRTGLADIAMAVIVQRMVPARAAGVLFTADPRTGRRDRLWIEAVPGLGEALVSGHAQPDSYRVGRDGLVWARDLRSDSPILGDALLERLAREARVAERAAGHPLDLEFAIDADGATQWLQGRPITALPADPDELAVLQDPGDLYTTCNIGECMPGPITPLSFSTVWWADDQAIQRLHVRCGIQPAVSDDYRVTRLYFGHLALNLTRVAKMATHVAGARADRVALAICGRALPELDPGPPASTATRLRNLVRYVGYLRAGQAHAERLERLVGAMTASMAALDVDSAAALYEVLDRNLPRLADAFDHHMTSSAGAGALQPMLMQILARGEEPGADHHAQAAALLSQATTHDVESADVAAGVDRLLDVLAAHPGDDARFLECSPDEALAWLRSDEAGPASRELERYLARHGHRSIRELELRQPEWASDPRSLVASLQAGLRARRVLASRGRAAAGPSATGARRPGPLLAPLVRLTHRAVRRREHTKALLVRVVAVFKRGYRALGERLAGEGALPDVDAVYFLTHAELGRLCRGEGRAALAERAVARRGALAYQSGLRLPDLFTGYPEPEPEPEPPDTAPDDDGVLHGKPVSHGRVRGIARVAWTVQEAAQLAPGEILIAPVTDVGWSPYFALIGGLATDVGSAVSHGAVVAREYGLPAVVDLRRATRVFRTGDRVVLDADRGTLAFADPADRERA